MAIGNRKHIQDPWESFRIQEHLYYILDEAQTTVSNAMATITE